MGNTLQVFFAESLREPWNCSGRTSSRTYRCSARALWLIWLFTDDREM